MWSCEEVWITPKAVLGVVPGEDGAFGGSSTSVELLIFLEGPGTSRKVLSLVSESQVRIVIFLVGWVVC